MNMQYASNLLRFKELRHYIREVSGWSGCHRRQIFVHSFCLCGNVYENVDGNIAMSGAKSRVILTWRWGYYGILILRPAAGLKRRGG